jgi:hypothetical protein
MLVVPPRGIFCRFARRAGGVRRSGFIDGFEAVIWVL